MEIAEEEIERTAQEAVKAALLEVGPDHELGGGVPQGARAGG